MNRDRISGSVKAPALLLLVSLGLLSLLAAMAIPILVEGMSFWPPAERRRAEGLNAALERMYHAYLLEQRRRDRYELPRLPAKPPALVRTEQELASAEQRAQHAIRTPERWAKRFRSVGVGLLLTGAVMGTLARNRKPRERSSQIASRRSGSASLRSGG